MRKDGAKCRVKWQGFPLSEASWEPVDELPKESIVAFQTHLMLENRRDIVLRHSDVNMRNACTYTCHKSTVMMCEEDENFVHDGLRRMLFRDSRRGSRRSQDLS